MRNIYYWYQNIPDDSKLNFYAEPDVFFGTTLSGNDSKNGNNYSWIEPSTGFTPEDTPIENYGFDFKLYVKQSANRSFARILYVIPGSPADNAGIKRGDWLATFGGYRITANNEEMLQTGGASDFTLAKYEAAGMGEDEKPIYDWVTDSLNVIPIKSDNYPWIIHPTVAMLYNKNDKLDYYNGFTPTLAVDESTDYSPYKELGDPEELLLSKTIDVIINGLPTEDEDGEETETNTNH